MNARDIISKYSFFQPDSTLRTNLIAFGFECGAGWYPLIDELCGKIEKILEGETDEFRKGFQVLQVKEKFAGLRFYVTYGNDEIWDLIEEYERRSFEICENCGGTPAKVYEKHHWLRTRCDACWKSEE